MLENVMAAFGLLIVGFAVGYWLCKSKKLNF